jgi:hypothetical protein
MEGQGETIAQHGETDGNHKPGRITSGRENSGATSEDLSRGPVSSQAGKGPVEPLDNSMLKEGTVTDGGRAGGSTGDSGVVVAPSGADRGNSFTPNYEIPFPFAERTRGLSPVEILTLTGFRAHTVYWEENFEAEKTAFDDVIPLVFKCSRSEILGPDSDCS